MGHKINNCPMKKKSDGKSKDEGDWKGSSKKGGNKSHVRCHYCKKLGHIRPHCPKLQDMEKNEDGAHTIVDLECNTMVRNGCLTSITFGCG